MTTSKALLLPLLSLALLSACSGDDDGDTGSMTRDGGPGDTRDAGPRDGGDVVVGCNNPALTPPSNGTCSHTAGTNGALLIRGDVIAPEGFLQNAHVLVGADGKVKCAACDCSAQAEFASAAVLECAEGVISPALVNAHDHITFTETPPTPPTNPQERYEHRHDWRRGQNGHEEISSVSNRGGNDGVLWGELRHLFGGATAINGSGGANGLLRNLDRTGAQQEGLEQQSVEYQTFPLGDSGGARRDMGCGYPSLDTPADYANNIAYAPHIAEGIDDTARNEFLCLSGVDSTGSDVLDAKTAVIHGIGLIATDYAAMAAAGSSLIWSPRSNISLYGHTAQVVLAKRSGVNIALGTDWTQTGSINLLRELRCAADFNRENLGGHFNDRELVAMVTSNAAAAMGSASRLGTLAAGREADIAIFDGSTNAGYRAILNADPDDVVLVLRAGTVLYGDAEIVAALPMGGTGCEALDVCGVQKRACIERETGSTMAQIRSALPDYTYDLFFCDTPTQEPSCIPFRAGEFMGMGMQGDMDGDGVVDAMDNCPTVFNAPRPLDGNEQPDADDDMVGDACDVCPLNADTSNCTPPDPNDLDGDGVPNATDNCPGMPNMDQADRDMDMIGDICDTCPDESNLNGAACSASVYTIKQGMVSDGTRVRVTNMLVTGVSPTGVYMQTIEGDDGYDTTLRENYSGLFVFTGAAMSATRGDRVTVDGDVNNYFGQWQLENATFTVLSSGNALPTPIMITPAEGGTGGARATQLESVLVRVGTVTVTEVEPTPGAGETAPTFEFVVDGALRVNDHFYRVTPLPQVGDSIQFIVGILRLANENSKIEPRDADDIGVPPGLRGFTPAIAYARVGETAVPGGGFAVELTRAALADTTITLSANGVGVPASVTVVTGERTADVEITATSSAASPYMVFASYDDGMTTQTATGTVIVYDDAAPRSLDDASLDITTIPVNGTAMGSVTIDLPGAVGGTAVTLSVMPTGVATVPPMVTIAQDARTATFTLTAGANPGMATLRVSVGNDMETIPFEVVQSTSRAPMPGDLIITEVHRNPSGADEFMREWFEVYNASTDAILIDGIGIADNGGMHTVAAPGVEIMPGQHVVFARLLAPASNGGVTAIAAYDGPSNIQLANGADRIVLSHGGTELDRVEWASGWPGGGQGVAMCLAFPYMDNAVQTNWHNSVGMFGTGGDTGHPGVQSDATNCP